MTTQKLGALLLTASLTSACGGAQSFDDGPLAVGLMTSDLARGPFPEGSGPLEQSDAEARAAQILNGRVVASSVEEERGLTVFEVEVVRPSGALFEIDIVALTGQVLEIECEYHVEGEDLEVASGYLSLAQAIEAAQRFRPGRVVEWEIELDDDLAWVWQFILTEAGAYHAVTIDAMSGAARAGAYDAWDDQEVDFDERCFSDDDDFEEGCSSDDDDEDEYEPDYDRSCCVPSDEPSEALNAILGNLVPGANLKSADQDADRSWDVELLSPAGEFIEVELTPNGRVISAESELSGPMDYDVRPAGMLTLTQAIAATGRSVTQLEAWELEREDGVFVWTLEFEGQDLEVNAVSGQLSDD